MADATVVDTYMSTDDNRGRAHACSLGLPAHRMEDERMTPDEYCREDATGLAALVRSEAVSQKELAEMMVGAVATLNPELNCVIECFEDRLANLPDRPQDPDAPFAGVPWLLKDIGAGEPGRKQEQGSRLLEGHLVEAETQLATKLRSSGLVNLGRTKIPEFAYDGNTESLLEGSTRNPWDTRLSAGGSSGGAAASVASGILPAAHASDGGGSIRIPASFNGLVGLKPTRGRISTWPIFIADRPLGHAVEFAVCRSIRDAAGLLDALNGPAPAEPVTLPPPDQRFPAGLDNAPEALRIAISWDNGGPCKTHPAAIEAIEAVAQVLEEQGHHVEKGYPDADYLAYAKAMTDLWSVEIATMLDEISAQTGQPLDDSTLEPNALGLIERSQRLSAKDMMQALLITDNASKAFHDFLSDHDILVTPATPGAAPPLATTGPFTKNRWTIDFAEETTAAMCQYAVQANMSGQPAISLPLAWTEGGLPIGIQLQARYGDELTLLRLGRLLEQAMPWADSRPRLHLAGMGAEGKA